MRIDQLTPGQKFKAEWFGADEAMFVALDSDGDAWFARKSSDCWYEADYVKPSTEVTLIEDKPPEVKVPKAYVPKAYVPKVKVPKVKVPEGWYILRDSDTVQRGDKYVDDRNLCHDTSAQGCTVKEAKSKYDFVRYYIRKVAEIPEGYEVLDDDAVLQDGDVYLDNDGKRVHVCSNIGMKVKDAMPDMRRQTPPDHPDYCRVVIRPKVKDYATLQAEWVAKHDIKAGSKVRVVRRPTGKDPDDRARWVTQMDGNIGKVLIVTSMSTVGILAQGWVYPFFCLEPVTEKLVPFGFEDNLVGLKTKSKDGTVRATITYQGRENVAIGSSLMSYAYLLEHYETLTGLPLGKWQ